MCVKQHNNVGWMKFNYKEMQFDLGEKVKLGINKIFWKTQITREIRHWFAYMHYDNGLCMMCRYVFILIYALNSLHNSL